MGLIKNNYQFKGYNLHTAYARVKVNTERNKAVFYIGASRDMAFNDPIDKVEIYIPFTNTKDPRIEAYEYVKGQYEEMEWNEKTNKYEKVVKYRPFFDWTDIDI